MAEHTVSQVVRAPIGQVYEMWSRFGDYPKFMSHVKEVTIIDQQRSHWVVDMIGRHEWDAQIEDWVPNERIAWCATDGLENRGDVTFSELAGGETLMRVHVSYTPPAGALGAAGEVLGAGATFESGLKRDLERFAMRVASASAGSLDPNSSSYVFGETDKDLDEDAFGEQYTPTLSEPEADIGTPRSRR